MPRKKSHIHFIYKTTCLITNRYYVGMHSTSKLDDGYMGSGKRLRYSIRKYGVENHKREVLMFFDNRELLIEGEENFITDEMVVDYNCMNLRKGGSGGFTVEQQRENGRRSNIKQKLLRESDPEWYNKKCENISLGNKVAYDEGRRKKYHFHDWTGEHHSEETKQKMRKSKNVGSSNSQYGTCWITNEIENKKIKKNESTPIGWKLGRTLK